MKDDVLKYYEKSVRAYALVMYKIKWNYRIFVVSFFCLILSSVSIVVCSIPSFPKVWSLPVIISFWTFVAIGIIFLTSYLFLNWRAKGIVRDKFGISHNHFIWRTSEFDRKQVKLMSEYLVRSNLLTTKKVGQLIELFREDIKNNKAAPLIAPGIALAFITPSWVQYINYVYTKNEDVKTVTDAQSVLMQTAFLALIIVIVVSVILRFKNEIADLFFSEQLNRKKNLVSLLEDVRLAINED
ncbi:hypothetical protein [Paenibacillus apii]|uniref:hypothetical protein n=1 Tax=Paenibacillus apii TaxID=1850370 RepID=UPI001438F431|nr:hypothetical protein [Paenibacillus apii]NJJ37797.1 hypothetical protein [Paenibacillus apii]